MVGAAPGQPAPVVPGLDNLGNTCYVNSVLQALASCPAFVGYLSSLQARRASLPGRPASAAPAALLDCLAALQPTFPEAAEAAGAEGDAGERGGARARSAPSRADEAAAALFESLRTEGGFVRGPEQDASEALTWLLDAVAEEAAAVWKLPGGGKTAADRRAFLDGLLAALPPLEGEAAGEGEEEGGEAEAGQDAAQEGRGAGAGQDAAQEGRGAEAGQDETISGREGVSGRGEEEAEEGAAAAAPGEKAAGADAVDPATAQPTAQPADATANGGSQPPAPTQSPAGSGADASSTFGRLAAAAPSSPASFGRLAAVLPPPLPYSSAWRASTPLPFEGTTVQTLRCLKCHEELDSTATTFRLLTLPLVEPRDSAGGGTALGVPVGEAAAAAGPAARAARAGARAGAPPSAASLEVLADSPLLAPFIAAGRAQGRRDAASRPPPAAPSGPQPYSLRDSFAEAFAPEIAGPYVCRICVERARKEHAEALEAWERQRKERAAAGTAPNPAPAEAATPPEAAVAQTASPPEAAAAQMATAPEAAAAQTATSQSSSPGEASPSPSSPSSSFPPPPPAPHPLSSVLRRSTLGRTPRALILHLDRVAWDPSRGPVKRGGHVSFPAIFRIDALAPRWGEEPREQGRAARAAGFDAQESLKLYELSAVVEHAGAAETGHYVTWRRLRRGTGAARAPEETGSLPPPSDPADLWARASDDEVRLGGLRDALRADATLLFYDLVELQPKAGAK